MIRTKTRLQYANGYLDLGMVRDAEAELDAIADEDQSNGETLSLRVCLYSERKDWKRMESVSKELISLDGKSAFGWVNLAYALREMERVKEAKEVATEGLERQPKEAVLWFNLACYCSLLGEVEEASTHLDRAIELEKSFEASAVDDPDLENLWDWIKSKE